MLCMICDDQKSELEMMQKIISDYAGEHPDLFLAIQCFSNPFDMLEEMKQKRRPWYCWLDICMPGVFLALRLPGKSRAKAEAPPILDSHCQPRFCGEEEISSSPLLLRI